MKLSQIKEDEQKAEDLSLHENEEEEKNYN